MLPRHLSLFTAYQLPADNEPLRTELKTAFEEGRKIVVYVLSAMGEEKIVSMRDRE
ncbi:hypothetical protein AALP_AAs43932U000200 [Arabis alpina]|uniref:Translation initiation factor 5A C-terminal domain-containing protein n=1 Tax=Arabis alpina TaxID=50452 RepID=A0A087G377_ARAAL|nr:hypothetical protein AALP_AAs43932U000200 [Arabis alpina]